MADVHHYEEGANTGLTVVLILLVVAIGAFLLWCFLPRTNDTQNTSPGINLDINTGGGSGSGSGTGTGGGSTY